MEIRKVEAITKSHYQISTNERVLLQRRNVERGSDSPMLFNEELQVASLDRITELEEEVLFHLKCNDDNMKAMEAQVAELQETINTRDLQLLSLDEQKQELKAQVAELQSSHLALALERKCREAVEQERVIEVLRQDTEAWSTLAVLEALTAAAEHLLGEHACDTDGHERWHYAVARSKIIQKEWAKTKAKETSHVERHSLEDPPK